MSGLVIDHDYDLLCFIRQFSADVVACNRNPKTGMVQGLDTYNEPDQTANVVDPYQNVVLFSSNYTEGRIMCRYVCCTCMMAANVFKV